MLTIISGAIAASLAWMFNGIFTRFWGNAAIIVIIPVVEEFLKSLIPYFLHTSIFFCHLVFGIIEAFWDMKANIKGVKPGLLSILTHTFLGIITVVLYNWTGYLSLGIIASITLHILWNRNIIINYK